MCYSGHCPNEDYFGNCRTNGVCPTREEFDAYNKEQEEIASRVKEATKDLPKVDIKDAIF